MIVRVFSVALLIVPLLTGSASAECAWVMWIEETDREMAVTWTFARNIYVTRRACESALPSAMDFKVDVFTSLGHVFVGPGEDGPKSGALVRKKTALRSVVAGARGQDGQPLWATTYDFHCFPDTVDPRGPKGR